MAYNRDHIHLPHDDQDKLELTEGIDRNNYAPQEKPPEVVRTSDREELIECIKKGQRPEWVPKPTLKALCAEEEAAAQSRVQHRHVTDQEAQVPQVSSDDSKEHQMPFPNIPERPPSAFHAGDFRATEPSTFSLPAHEQARESYHSIYSGANSPPWPPSALDQGLARAISTNGRRQAFLPTTPRARAPSLGSSLSSSFVMRTPTSPLVHATSYDGQGHVADGLQQASPVKSSRRMTLPPNAFPARGFALHESTPPNFSRPLQAPPLRREFTTPLQGHRPRHSLSSFTYQPLSIHQAPASPRLRRLSVSSELSRSSMVGSFEESILRGRMSTPPSKPLDFVAEIGVLGKGDCPPSLKCPPHVSVPFSAVFYNYIPSTNTRTIVDDTPSPYVGTIDLENNLKPVCITKRKRKQANRSDESRISEFSEGTEPDVVSLAQQSSPKAPPGGAYRVPQQGQLQIVIKNPNKTAVKLFLIPYDLEGMPPGTKTFVRQRSFSSGPILEVPIATNPDLNKVNDPLRDKHILRYLVHLKFCCTSKSRFYLHHCIRVVFANRVPDGKENLRNEIQLPEPRFSTYRPQNNITTSPISPAVRGISVDRLGPGFSMPAHFDAIDGISEILPQHHMENLVPPATPTPVLFSEAQGLFDEEKDKRSNAFPRKMPFQIADSKTSPMQDLANQQALSPIPGFRASTSRRASPVPWHNDNQHPGSGRFSPIPPEAGDGLLSRQLREWNITRGSMSD